MSLKAEIKSETAAIFYPRPIHGRKTIFLVLVLSCLLSKSQIYNFSVYPSHTICSIASTSSILATVMYSPPFVTSNTWIVTSPSGGSSTVVPLSPPTLSTALFNFNGCGVYTITCLSYSNSLLIVTIIHTVSLVCSSSPTLTLNSSVTGSICPQGQATLSAISTDTVTWSPFVVVPSIVVSPTINTCYTATVTSNVGCSSYSQICVGVVMGPSLTVTNNTTICSGAVITLSAAGATSYTWMNTGSNVSSITVTPTTSANYTVIGGNGTCAKTTSVINVLVDPTPVLTTTVSPAKICAGESTTLFVNGASYYNWSNGNFGNSITVSPTVSTNYTVTGFLNGCNSSQTLGVVVNANPTLLVTFPSTICSGTSFTLSVAGAQSYTWGNGSNSSSLIIAPISSTIYSVTGMDFNSCISKTILAVNVTGTPTITLSGKTVYCYGDVATLTANGANTYTWDSGSSGSTLTFTAGNNLPSSVNGTGQNGCTASLNFSLQVNDCVGLNETIEEWKYKITPNPAIGFVTFSSKSIELVTYEIFNSIGKKVLTGKFLTEVLVDVGELKPGLYNLVFTSGYHQKSLKLLIQNR